MLQSFENVKKQAFQASNEGHKDVLRNLEARQRIVLTLFIKSKKITANDIANILGISPRSARNICTDWVEKGFLIIADHAKKSRKYELTPEYENLLDLT